ncbi:class I adenylate-forming enzyme family protein [Thalassobius vesicularis]|uniref:class I adenylate-forming enzyme family protein n=1 Tax=Thalassobius vesicularis TaxID=1294297 RepID=UPI002483174A|nr:long-chain fatty acid--CoA ligase [Thalassobius vesicularis]
MHIFTPPPVQDETLIQFGQVIQANAAQMGDKPALICNGEVLSWSQLGNRVARTTGALRERGIGRGDFVAALGENSVSHLVLILATLAAGACIVPLPFSATEDALRHMLQDSGARVLFSTSAYADTAARLGAPEVLDMSVVDDWSRNVTPADPVEIHANDLFNLIYSSGTTGTPKGIVHDHRFRSRQLARITRFGLTPDSRMVMSTPLYSNTTMFGVLPTLILGATLILMPKFDITTFLSLSQTWKATHAVLVPVQYMRLLRAPEFASADLTSYRCKFSASAPLPGSLIAQIMERWPGNLIEVYGMTEGGVSTALNCAEFPDKWDTVGRPPRRLGRARDRRSGQRTAPRRNG